MGSDFKTHTLIKKAIKIFHFYDTFTHSQIILSIHESQIVQLFLISNNPGYYTDNQ